MHQDLHKKNDFHLLVKISGNLQGIVNKSMKAYSLFKNIRNISFQEAHETWGTVG